MNEDDFAELKLLREWVTKQVNTCEDMSLLDLVYKLFAAEGVGA